MKRKYLASILFVILVLVSCAPAPAANEPADIAAASPTAEPPTPPPPTATVEPTPAPEEVFPPEVVEYVHQLVDGHKVPGISIGWLTPEGVYYFNYGTVTWENDQKIDEHTLFEIGSITKVFTAILLANAAQQEMVTLDTLAQELAPQGVSMPLSVNQGMTLRDIASQRSGLPRMPSNFNPAKTLNPYADYTPELMYEYLDGLMLGRKPGAQYEYSNLGFMLLGDLMERAYGQPYEELVAQIITGPLNMPDTVITLTDEQQTRLALPHSGGYPVKSWDFALPGVGALRSTSADMLNFLAANLNPGDDVLGQAMALIRAECYATGTTFVDVCLGIHTYHRYSKLMYQHDGETGGYHSFSAFVPDDGTAVIILANSNYNIDELGLHLLEPAAPLPDLD